MILNHREESSAFIVFRLVQKCLVWYRSRGQLLFKTQRLSARFTCSLPSSFNSLKSFSCHERYEGTRLNDASSLAATFDQVARQNCQRRTGMATCSEDTKGCVFMDGRSDWKE